MPNTTEESLRELLAGSARFASGSALHPHQDPARRAELATGQHPSTVVVSCSDSRTAPELVLDQGLGDLFTVRTAGHLIDAQTVASVEFALAHLGSRRVLILGHESCGAIAGALGSEEEIASQPGLLPALLRRVRAHLDPEEPARGAVERHVRGCLEDLLDASALVRELRESGELLVVGAVHSLATGATAVLDEAPAG